jgi:uncharacterized membrane-anchored protein
MNNGRQQNSWVAATYLVVMGATGILQLFVFSKQPEAAFVVLTVVVSSLLLGIGMLLLAMYIVNVRTSRKLGSGTGDTLPDRGDSASAMALRATENDKSINWLWKDESILVVAILVFIVAIAKVGLILDAIFSYHIPVTMMPISMLIAGLWFGCSVFYVTAYVRRKRKPRSMEAPPRLARSRGQPKEAREE